jgi:hypothetical protein
MKIGIRFALATVSIILVVSLAANGYLYNSLSENNSLQKQNEEMQSQISSLQSQAQNLQNQITDLKNQSNDDNDTIAALNIQIASLQQEKENLTALVQSLQNKSSSDVYAPYLVTRLGATFDYGYGMVSSYLYVQGFVSNEGNVTASKCALKITSQTNQGTSYTDYYRFNTLSPRESVKVDTHIYHEDLKNWTIIPECTNTP